MFFDEFIDNVYNNKFICDPRLKDRSFRSYIINTHGENRKTVKMFKDSLATTLKKPQRCLYTDIDYYFAIDLITHTHYICYKHLMIIDIDIGKNEKTQNIDDYLNFLDDYIKQNNDFIADIYKSRKGLHIFILHQEYDFNQDNSIELMLKLGADFYYIIYSNIRGWSVRLNPKREDSIPIYTFFKRIGNGKPIDRLEKLVKLHIEFTELCQEVGICKMK